MSSLLRIPKHDHRHLWCIRATIGTRGALARLQAPVVQLVSPIGTRGALACLIGTRGALGFPLSKAILRLIKVQGSSDNKLHKFIQILIVGGQPRGGGHVGHSNLAKG